MGCALSDFKPPPTWSADTPYEVDYGWDMSAAAVIPRDLLQLLDERLLSATKPHWNLFAQAAVSAQLVALPHAGVVGCLDEHCGDSCDRDACVAVAEAPTAQRLQECEAIVELRGALSKKQLQPFGIEGSAARSNNVIASVLEKLGCDNYGIV
eukprot:TRINITY_DN7405_c0_g1_i5.p2 TRINITY_DN7405_c0_g1~~TRINITY_DN7405_c0_g1_i5.p2  ORF type:complete len:153 (-),score=33.44 TRINITY_DN7405_c0_g1_i5:99-557(-)